MKINTVASNMVRTLIAIATLYILGSDTLSAETRPNILFCISDDQSYVPTAANGDPVVKTLIDLCGLPEREDLDGQSLKPLLENPKREWQRPVVMTYGFNNHAVQTQRWRYIRYHDGGQELYDHSKDPEEWTNLAGSPEYEKVITKLKTALPDFNGK